MRKTKTMLQTFHPDSPGGQDLFSVQPGVSVIDALEQASAFLASAISIIYDAEPDSSNVFGAAYLAEMAKGVVDACISGLMKGDKS